MEDGRQKIGTPPGEGKTSDIFQASWPGFVTKVVAGADLPDCRTAVISEAGTMRTLKLLRSLRLPRARAASRSPSWGCTPLPTSLPWSPAPASDVPAAATAPLLAGAVDRDVGAMGGPAASMAPMLVLAP